MGNAVIIIFGILALSLILMGFSGSSFGAAIAFVSALLVGTAFVTVILGLAANQPASQRNCEKIRNLVEKHRRTLLGKKRRLCYFDEYGILHSEKWEKEKQYFFRNVIEPELECEIVDNYIDAKYAEYETCLDSLLNVSEESNPGVSYHPEMSGAEYEILCQDLLNFADGEATLTPTTGDSGADLIVDFKGKRIIVQCKRSKKTIGNRAVQEVASAVTLLDGDVGVVVTDNGFTRAAKQAAHGHGVFTITHEEISNFIEKLSATA